MEGTVSADAQDLKVLQSIVGLVAVSVMDELVSLQLPPKMLFHDDTVLKLEVSTNTDCDVSI